MRILVIEDEAVLRSNLTQQLESMGYRVDAAPDGEAGFFLGREYPFDLAIIDLGLPRLSGMEVIQKFRQLDLKFPILILTARSHWKDKVDGLESGADDYLVKPFQTEELLARVNALIRRSVGWASSKMVFGGLEIDTLAQTLSVHGKLIDLTAFEYRLLEYLMMHAGEVVSKTTLTEHLYDQDFDRDSNVIEVFVGRLRKKLEPTGIEKPIETLRGRGYRFVLTRDMASE